MSASNLPPFGSFATLICQAWSFLCKAISFSDRGLQDWCRARQTAGILNNPLLTVQLANKTKNLVDARRRHHTCSSGQDAATARPCTSTSYISESHRCCILEAVQTAPSLSQYRLIISFLGELTAPDRSKS